MKPSTPAVLALALCMGACAEATGGRGQPSAGRSVWKGEDETFVSMFSQKQDDNLLRLAQDHSAEQALREELESKKKRQETVPPSMYRTAEPPLPEPDLSLPVTDVARPPAGASSPSPSSSPQPAP